MTVRAASGPWGSVRTLVKADRGTYCVHLWVNALPQTPIYGLDYREAHETAAELVDTWTSTLILQHERKVTFDEVLTEATLLGETIADTRQVGAAVDYVNTMYSYPKEARLACAVRELRGLSKASPDSDVNFG